MLINVLDCLEPPIYDPADPNPVRTAYTLAVTKAISVAATGDRVYIPGVRNFEAPPNGWIVDKSLEIFGDGPGGSLAGGTGTTLSPSSIQGVPGAGYDVFVLTLPQVGSIENVYIHDLAILCPAGRSGRDGIRFYPDIPDIKLSACRLEHLRLENLGACGVRLGKTSIWPARPNDVVSLWMSDVGVDGCGGVGIDIQNAYVGELVRVRCAGNLREGLRSTNGGLIYQACTFEANKVGGDASVKAEMVVVGGYFSRIDACQFKDFAGSGTGVGLQLQDPVTAMISGCDFTLSTSGLSATGLELVSPTASAGAVAIFVNRFNNCGTGIRAADSFRALTVMPQSCPTNVQMVLPSAASSSPFGEPSRGIASGAGLMLPAGVTGTDPQLPTNPTSNVQRGTLYYSVDDNVVRVRLGSEWFNVLTQP